jgi:hypothetical protein
MKKELYTDLGRSYITVNGPTPQMVTNIIGRPKAIYCAGYQITVTLLN